VVTWQNKYYKRSRISEAKFRQLVRLFAQDLRACDVAALTGLQRKTVNTIFFKIRIRIAQQCERQQPLATGDIEVDESYFGPRRVRGKRGRGAGNKTPMFGLLKRQGKVYTEIVPDRRKATLQAIIRGRVAPESVIHSDGWRGYDDLVDICYAKHLRVDHGNNEFGFGSRHINGIESFWSFAKRRLRKFNGVPAHTFYLHLKECEWRFNQRHDNLHLLLFRLLQEKPICDLSLKVWT
jgi:transposase